MSRSKNLKDQRFGKLVVLEECGRDRHQKAIWKCQCDCGNVSYPIGSNLLKGTTTSCGCVHKKMMSDKQSAKLLGKKFGRLLVIKQSHFRKTPSSGKRKIVWDCLCDCGGKSKVTSDNLSSGLVKSCGNCLLKKNSISTSYKALEIHKLLNNRGVHNYKTKAGPIVDIALVINNTKIAIEYNEWYWHGNKIDKDIQRTQNLIEKGWKVLNINANKNLPSQEQINDCISYLLKCANSVNLVLDGWGEGICR